MRRAMLKLRLLRLPHLALFVALAGTAGAALVHCGSRPDESEISVEQRTGIGNVFGLGLRYDATHRKIVATLDARLPDDERLFVRVRRGKITLTSQKDLDCADVVREGTMIAGVGRRDARGKLLFDGPNVDPSLVDLLHLYDDARWATGDVAQSLKDDVATLGPDPIVEACKMRGAEVRAKLQTNLAYAWDLGTKDGVDAAHASGIHVMDVDAATTSADDAGTDDAGAITAPQIDENSVRSQIEYGQLCVRELGEIPFFRKLGPGKYDTFDCRTLQGSTASGDNGTIAGVEGAMIPVTIDGVPQDKCSPGRELGADSESYGCMTKADHGMYLARGETQPGPMVMTARNDRGTHWVLLCRKVADNGKGMTHTTTFNDIAMIGHNPQTGRTCFFQNSIGSGRDGAHVAHPGDVEKSSSIWSSSVQSYCSGSCHAESAFVHSPWIDGAKRSNGHAIVPKIGELADFPISRLDAPYNIVAADQLGFSIPKQLVSDEVGACNNCHRLAGNTMGDFARWSTGTGDDYYGNITEFGKRFSESHWMPPRLDGVTEATWSTSKFVKSLEFMRRCDQSSSDPACLWADVPRGAFDNPRVH
jgi:hypothetical protein